MKEDFDSSRWKTLKHDDGRRRHHSPPRRQRHDSDQSPPRHDSDQSPPRGRQRHDSDQSPPRSRQRHDSDQSPPRRGGSHTEGSPARKRHRQRHDSDLSPRRSKQQMDLSPKRHRSPGSSKKIGGRTSPRRQNRWGTPLSDREGEYSRKTQNGRPSSTLDGKKAGLQHAQALREENKHMRQKEKEYFDTIESSVSGKGAKTVVRQEKARELEAKRRKKEQNDRRQAEINEKYSHWSKGVKQSADHRARMEQDIHEMNKPLARYAGDRDLEEHLKNKDREGDPMLAMVQKKRGKHSTHKKQKPIYEGDYPPNRYKIRPGYRWDGVDRSNGFEKDLFLRSSNKKAMEDDAYKWSVEDM